MKGMDIFFRKYQKEILKLANSDMGREFLEIPKKYDDKFIIKLDPYAFHYISGVRQYTGIFRAYPLFGIKLYGALTKLDIARDRKEYKGLSKYYGLLHYNNIKYSEAYPQIHLTTTTYYSGAGDGLCFNAGNTTYSDARNEVISSNAQPTETAEYIIQNELGGTGPDNYIVGRAFFPINTAGITIGQNVTAATFNWYYTNIGKEDNDSDSGILVQTTQDSTSTLTTADFNKCGTVDAPTEGSDGRITIASLSSAGYKTFTLNATGLGWVTVDGWTRLGIRSYKDGQNTTPVGRNYAGQCRMSEYSGTDYDPYLEATYSATAFDPTYKATITIDNTKVSDADSADLSNFPVLISGTYDGTGSEPDLRSTTNGGKIQSGAGYDIGFFSDSGLTTPLKYERELHNVATGAVSYWVKIPTLDYNNDTVIYMAYGDSVIMSNQEDKINVWNSNYVAVYHLKDNPNSKYVIDSTTNALNGTKRTAGGPAEATGIVNKGQQFDYSDKDYIDLTQNTLWNSNSLTVELFVYPTYYGDDNIVLSRDDETTRDWLLNTNTGWPTANRARFIGWNASGTLYKCVSDAQLTTNAWYHLVGRYDATANKLNMFVNGVKQTDDDDTSENIRQDAQQIQIGGFETATRYTSEGIYDEVRISNIARTDAWMITTYNAISSPSTFYAMGTETALTAGPTFIPKIWII